MKEYVSKPNFVNPVFSGKQTDAGRNFPTRINHTYKKLIFLTTFLSGHSIHYYFECEVFYNNKIKATQRRPIIHR